MNVPLIFGGYDIVESLLFLNVQNTSMIWRKFFVEEQILTECMLFLFLFYCIPLKAVKYNHEVYPSHEQNISCSCAM